jgi:hypothetical protein
VSGSSPCLNASESLEFRRAALESFLVDVGEHKQSEAFVTYLSKKPVACRACRPSDLAEYVFAYFVSFLAAELSLVDACLDLLAAAFAVVVKRLWANFTLVFFWWPVLFFVLFGQFVIQLNAPLVILQLFFRG